MTWSWQSEISLLLNANKVGKLHKLDTIFVLSDKTNFLETIWRNVQKNENKLSWQRSCHYQTMEHCLATDNRSTSSWKETSGACGCALQTKFDLGKFYAVFKLL